MKPIAKLFSLLIALATLSLVLVWWWKLLNKPEQEDDPYYIYGDSMYRGDHGDPIRYESDEEAQQRKEDETEELHVPDGHSKVAN